MPRVSRAKARQNHGAIRRASSRLMRTQGLRVSVADIMGAAGLTHGGFYGHFSSKDALLAAGCASAFAESAARWRARAADAADRSAALAALVQGYLADGGPVASGCPIASLAADVSREAVGKPVRRAFRAGLQELLGILTALQPEGEGRPGREQAWLQLCTMVGALVLARATQGHALSQELLHTVRRRLVTAQRAASARPRRARRMRRPQGMR
jgi:TetR/AcrR family transcriptional regulator, transcriptional repressor for nem operon